MHWETWELETTNEILAKMRGQRSSRESRDERGPVGILLRTGVGRGSDEMSRISKEVGRSTGCGTETAQRREVEAIEVGDVGGVERGIVVTEVSMPPCITRALTGPGEVTGVRRHSRAI